MDPNVALAQIRAQITETEHPARAGVDITGYAEEIIEQFKALDRWLSRGGFLPDEWKADR